jgi:hypothetical protein
MWDEVDILLHRSKYVLDGFIEMTQVIDTTVIMTSLELRKKIAILTFLFHNNNNNNNNNNNKFYYLTHGCYHTPQFESQTRFTELLQPL